MRKSYRYIKSNANYTFSGWTPLQTDVVVTDGKFTMPAKDVVLDFFYIPWYNKSVSKLTINVVDYLHLFFYNKR